MIKFIKEKLFGRFIKSKLYTDTKLRKTLQWDQIKNVGVLLDGSDPIALRLLLNRLKQYEIQGKKNLYLGFVKKLPPFEDEQIIWITSKDLSWVGIPKMNKIKFFIEKEFDVLINTAMHTIRPLEFVSTYSKANLRIGVFSERKTYCYDFMFRLLPGETTENYLDQVEHYLKMLKN